MITKLGLRDADLIKSVALPAAPDTITTAALDLGPKSIFHSIRTQDDVDIVAQIPNLPVGIVPDTRTVTVSIEASDDAAFGSGVDVLTSKVFTGAGGVGVSDIDVRTSPQRLGKRYLRAKAVTGASVADASAYALELSLNF